MSGSIARFFKSPSSEEQKNGQTAAAVEPEPGPSHTSKSDVDRMIAENMVSVLKSLKKKRSHKCSKRRRNGEQQKEEVDEKQETTEVHAPRRSPRKPTQKKEDEKTDSKENKKVNAFQLMMTSRNKAIGSNSPGKEVTAEVFVSAEREQNTKRKLKLEEWAERKGAGKRKIQEAAEEEFINHQMKRRAKRLKKLIKNMEPETDEEEAVVPVEAEDTPKASSNKRKVKRASSSPSVALKLVEKRGRLASDDSTTQLSVDKLEQSPTKAPATDDFIEKLNSPIKRKDSLLGYFNKVDKDTSSPEVEPQKEASPKRRSARRLAAEAVNREETVVDSPSVADSPSVVDSPILPATSERPRRSCAGKVQNYALLNGISPEKENLPNASKRVGKKPIITPLKIINVGLPQSMQVVKSPSVRRLSIDQDTPLTPTSSKNVKLAPLFVKKPTEDPEKVRARQEFLMSGIPEKMRLEIEKQRCYEESILNESPVFPLISHVQQLHAVDSHVHPMFRNSRVKILPESPGRSPHGSKLEEFEFNTLTNCDDALVEATLAKLVGTEGTENLYDYELPAVPKVKNIVREWKQTYKHFPVFKCYKQYQAKYEEQVQECSPPRPHRSVWELHKTTIPEEDSVEFIETPFSDRNGEFLFTEKYKPTSSEQILINCQPAIALKKFLSSWKEDNRSNNPAYDSEGEFELSNSTASSNSTSICNHIVLVGPPGCGKTSNVYAVANDMNFNVLELNASSRRKGKIILQELHEATQSHQVRRKEDMTDIFKRGTQNQRKGSKHKTRKLSTDSNDGGSKKLSLILIEDADVVFEQDDGFLGAVNQLVTSSKRPIVLTTTDANCPHLSRYISNNVIRYVAPGIGHVAKLLSILALVENVYMDQHDLGRLYALNGKDLRKTVNELQFFIQSGGDREMGEISQLTDEPELKLREDNAPALLLDDDASRQSNSSSNNFDGAAPRKHRSLFRLFSRNQNEPQFIRAPLNFDNLWCNMERVLRAERSPIATKGRRKKKQQKTTAELDELVFFYDNISSAAMVQRNAMEVKDRLTDHAEEEVAHYLVEKSWEHWFEGELTQAAKAKRRSGVGGMCYDSLKRFDTDDRQLISSYIGVSGIRTRSTHCDYEPFLRTICRYERDRSQAERRGSRFYHYFRNFINSTSTGSAMASNFSVDHFDALSGRFECDLPSSTSIFTAATTNESSEESR